ncbi:hypothetical protein ACNOYE_07545 [Nannocystaceae bacterium ST9]
MAADTGRRPTLELLALLLACSFAYFVGPPAWNQNSRLALTRALVEQGRVTIDEHHATTGDKSLREGHFYSDKAPGVSLLSTIPYALFVAERRLTGGELPDVRVETLDPAIAAADRAPAPAERAPGDVLVYNPAHRVALWLCRMIVISLPSVLAGLLMFVLLARQTRRTIALGTTLIWLLATPALGYACGLYGHQIVAALLFAAFALVVLDEPLGLRERGLGLLIGGLLGWAVLCEYTSAVPVALLLGWASWRRGWRLGGWIAIGGLPWALVLAGYHAWAFGSPLATGYDFVYLEEFAEGMKVNYGIGAPDLGVLIQLLFGSYRGLFYLAPVLLLAAWGLGVALVRAPTRSNQALTRGDFLLALALITYYLLLNAGYYMWDGGAALGPRHAVPMLPFLCLGLIAAFEQVPRATWVLAGISSLQVVLITAAGPEAPGWGNPIWSYALPELLAEPSVGGATTAGRLLGLPGWASLLPLFGLWWLLGRELGKRGSTSAAIQEPASERVAEHHAEHR